MRRTLISLAVFTFFQNAYAANLSDILKGAELTDPTLAASKATRDGGQENVAIARAKLLPQIGVQGVTQKTNQLREDHSALAGVTNTRYKVNATNSQIYFKQALFNKRDWDGLSIANIQAEYADYQLAGSFSDLWQRTVAAWLDVIAARETKNIYAAAVESAQHAANQAKKSWVAGSGTKDGALEAESQLKWSKANLVEANLNLDSRSRFFQNLTGVKFAELNKYQLPSYSKIRFPANNYQDFYRKTLDFSPTLIVSKLTEEIRKAQVTQAGADHYPTLDLVSSYTRTNNDNVNLIGSKVTSSAVGVQLSIPIYSGGGVNASVRQASAFYLAAISERQALELKINNQIDADWAMQEAYMEKIEGALLMAQAAKESLRSNQMSLKAGIKTWGDVAIAQTNLVKRQIDYVNYLSGGLKAQLRLLSLLPISDESWLLWLGQLDSEASIK